MKITYNWLKEFIDGLKDISPQDIANSLTMSGTEVKKLEYVGEKYKNLLVGEILSYEKHPNADRLSLCKVNVGNNILNIVCGANNFKEKDKVVVALEGAKIGETVIRKNKIRGIISEGMMCSEKELELSDESSGIMILDDSFIAGKWFSEQSGLDDWVFELEITPNRPDCLSVIGIAREVCANYGFRLKLPDYSFGSGISSDDKLTIEIDDYNLCPRYSAKIFKNVSGLKTPFWLRNRLLICDIRSINLIVDLTNYVMTEVGQPMHAFDFDAIGSKKIIIRNAHDGEKIITIDGQERLLSNDNLVIATEKEPIALAGIMGGKSTEINCNTKNVLLESANFNGASIMKTSKKLGLRSEASNRFEKKLDPYMTVYAIKRFEDLLFILTGYKSENHIYDNYLIINREREIKLRPSKVKDVLGIEVDIKIISKILSGLGFKNEIEEGLVKAIVPSFRFEDVEREIDLVEEIARIYGFEKIPSQLPRMAAKQGKYSFYQKALKNIRNTLADFGLKEVINYSFSSKKEFELFNLNIEEEFKDYIKILNPLNEDFEILRTSLIQSLVKNAKDNINKKLNDLSFFEISKVFRKLNLEDKVFYAEKMVLGIMLTGKAIKKSWNMNERFVDFYDLKGILESLYDKFFGKNNNSLSIKKKEYKFFHPSISGEVLIKNKSCGLIGKIHPKILGQIDLKQDIYYLELDLDFFINNIPKDKKYKQISQFPPVNIDLAFIVDEEILCEDIEKEIFKSSGKLLRSLRLFDLYSGKQIGEGKKSLAFSLEFVAKDRTLKDTEIGVLVNRIVSNLAKKFGAKLRDN